jgi:hypothetical protein
MMFFQRLNCPQTITFFEYIIFKCQEQKVAESQDRYSHGFLGAQESLHSIPVMTQNWQLESDTQRMTVSFARSNAAMIPFRSRLDFLDPGVYLRWRRTPGG